MDVVDTKRYEMLVRVRDFGLTHGDVFLPDSVAGKAFAIVADAVQQLSDHRAAQASGRGAARWRGAAR